jgi:hypothetical protein
MRYRDGSQDSEIILVGHEQSGYFWEGVGPFLRPELADRPERRGSKVLGVGCH